jgi:hypothetical protein
MSDRVRDLLLLALGAALAWLWLAGGPEPGPAPPAPPDARLEPPAPPDRPCPPRRPCPRWPALAGAAVGGPVAPDGTEVQLDLPPGQHQKNASGVDGAGLCVYASLRHSGRWHNEPVFSGLFDWMKNKPGGSWPDKTKKMIEQYAAERHLPVPPYLQVESGDFAVIQAACEAGLMPGITYSRSPSGRYSGQRISHMVTVLHWDGRQVGILDNNFPGTIEWCSRQEAEKVCAEGGKYWAVVPLSPPPPPPPHN